MMEMFRPRIARIVGGTIAGAADNPFQVALLQANIANSQAAQFCGGSLLQDRFVVTAAHCSDFLAANQAQVLTGTRRLDGSGVRRNVRRIVIHPQWDSRTFNNDVAVWELDTSATGIPLTSLTTSDGAVGTQLLATGWGAVGEGQPGSTDLRRVEVPLVDRTNCNDVNSYNGAITDRMLCAGRDVGGIDTCQGDSGGPLTRSGQLTGITSWGTGCARPNLFGIYTRLSNPAISDFIASTVNSSTGWRITNGGIGDFAGWAATSGVRPLTGDFNGDGRTDVALIRQGAGWASMPIAFANGDGSWRITNSGIGNFAGWAATSGVRPLTGDFNGDGRTDVALIRQGAGWASMPVAFANGDGSWRITNSGIGAFAGWAATSNVQPLTGDYNADGRMDVALIRQGAGWASMPVAFANGDGSWRITNSGIGDFAGWAATSNVQPLKGDYNADGRMDVALIRQSAGWATMPVAFANGDGSWRITNSGIGDFAGWAATSGVLPLSGDFNGDRRMDVALIRQTGGWATMPIAFAP
jgi:hypothetical protein